ncbi:hypothetical protein PHJA_001561700 [Phtheirospermum japonicum]|uniref:Uncharacterized protein n=1 Tax=Phtheirospermum japonicum TaxID=374723 RepID=A0A830C7M0_9LAMI|nr:hypothetical protein PHJA_001561700 [Phtheirospermum japonicum]
MTTTTESATTTPLVPITAQHHLPIKLTQMNYSSWRAHLIALLTGHDLHGYINDSFKKPSLLPDGSNATGVTHWVRQDNLLLAAIFGSLSPDILPLVSSTSSSSEAWDILTRLCAGRTCTCVNQLKNEIYRVEIKDRSITQYLHYVKAKADELALIDEPVSIDDLMLFVINDLGPEYATIVGPIRTQKTPLRYEELLDLLFADEQMIKSQKASKRKLLATANAASNRSSHHLGRGSNRGGSHGGSNSNHLLQNSSGQFACGQPSSSSQARGSSSSGRNNPSGCSSIICQLWGYIDHAAPTCRHFPITANYVTPTP